MSACTVWSKEIHYSAATHFSTMYASASKTNSFLVDIRDTGSLECMAYNIAVYNYVPEKWAKLYTAHPKVRHLAYKLSAMKEISYTHI